MRVAFFAYPSPYGLYTVYRNLRVGLLPEGIELRWVGRGTKAREAWQDEQWAGERAFGELVGTGTEVDDSSTHAAELIRHIEAGYQGAIVSPPYYRLEMNVMRYLRPDIVRVLSVQSMAFGVFRLVRPLHGHVHAAVGASPRVAEDVVRFGRFPADRTACVPNGVDPQRFAGIQRIRDGGTLRLMYLGRIEEAQKGVFWLPTILKLLEDVDVELTVAGDGKDLPELKRRCLPLAPRVRFAGVVPPAEVPALLGRHDVLLLTSRSEGLPSVLIEAMAAGCVPVASSIRGLTDFVIKDRENGLLFPVGDVAAAATALRRLASDPGELRRLSQAAVDEFHRRFTAEAMGRGYARVFQQAGESGRTLRPPEPLDRWRYPKEFSTGYASRLIPQPVKNMIQRWLS